MHSSNADPFDYQILNLTSKFYNTYPDPPYSEIIRKNTRPYNCLLIQSHYDYFIAIPYRSNINHKYSYRFKYSRRSQRTHSGLDYTKLVIIKNLDYVASLNAVVDADEYKETRDKIDYIKKDVLTYITDYIEYIQGRSNKYDEKSFQRAYGFSALKYFHRELGIAD